MTRTTRRKTITVTEAAVWLGISRQSAYQAVRDGAIPSIRLGRRIVIPVHALEAMLGVDSTPVAANQ
ncbi:MAG: helix-turn-helix domain-containing protein [Vulcanimicrobiota bacterium]